ncbi:hypothetical protein GQ457_06G021470 [Hibiscus cannabinus]
MSHGPQQCGREGKGPIGSPFSVECINFSKKLHRLLNSSDYVDASRCHPNSSSSSPWTYFYSPRESNISDFHQSCTFVAQLPWPFRLSNMSSLSTFDIYGHLLKGVGVSWYVPDNIWPSNPILKKAICTFFFREYSAIIMIVLEKVRVKEKKGRVGADVWDVKPDNHHDVPLPLPAAMLKTPNNDDNGSLS